MGATAGWLPDPTGRFELRYWDGEAWTEHVSTQGSTERDRLIQPDVRVAMTADAPGATAAHAKAQEAIEEVQEVSVNEGVAALKEGLSLGNGIKDDKAARWLQSMRPLLLEDENVRVLVRGSSGGLSDLIAVTDGRVLSVETANWRLKREVPLSDIADVKRESSIRGKYVTVTRRDGSAVKYVPHQMRGDRDVALLHQSLAALSVAEPDAALIASMDLHAGRSAAKAERLAAAEQGLWPHSHVFGSRPRKKAARTILKHCRPDEEPWLIIGSLGAGVLAAFEDRMVLIKTGAVTSMMAGSLGGERTTTFDFHHVTGLEYNAGFMNGVLEILTPSYDGSANRDFWRGTKKPRNADANDPFTLSNTLPLDKATYQQALPQLNELRRRISESHTPTVTVALASSGATPTGAGLADEIARLMALRDAGGLTEDEFQAAKAQLLKGV